jgi:hypothetical protein
MGEDLKGRFFSRVELEKEGWEFLNFQSEEIIVFKKGEIYIIWNSGTELVENEYEYEAI